MGPSPFSDGNCRTLSGSRSPPGSFNGAIAFQRWKSGSLPCSQLGITASMGPSPFSDGNVLRVLVPAVVVPASMGPSPFSDGNKTDTLTGPVSEIPLQWGHRLSAMEIARLRRMPSRTTRFNGAIAFQRWKCVGEARCERGTPRFNGAIAFQRWKFGS